jgi:hypothetical protein
VSLREAGETGFQQLHVILAGQLGVLRNIFDLRRRNGKA